MKDHHFNPHHAVTYGVNAAIILHSIIWWIEKNIANKKHFHEGRTWTYNSISAWATLCPYLSKKQVRTSLELLRTQGVLIVGNFSDNPKDQTLWYALVDEAKYVDPDVIAKAQQGKDRARRGKVQAQQGKSYKGSDINTVKDTVINTPLPPSGSGDVESENVFEKEKINTNSVAEEGPGEAALDLFTRQEAFRKEVYDAGRLKYTEEMLKRFYRTYSQPDNAKKPKMRWEKERRKVGWNTADRLESWATRNLDRIQCYLTENQKTIVQKRREFAAEIEAFKDRYPRDILISFYRKWSLPENVPDPQRMAWESEPYWDLATKLAQYKDNFNKPKH